jgi:hypothetical protein
MSPLPVTAITTLCHPSPYVNCPALSGFNAPNGCEADLAFRIPYGRQVTRQGPRACHSWLHGHRLSVAVADDVAFGHCFGQLHGTLTNGTATKGICVRVTFCFRKLGGAWQIVHDQPSVPFDVLSGRGVADLEP